MDKRVKYSIKQKEAVVKSILGGRSSIKSKARELGCARSAIRRWLAQYKQHGKKGMEIRNGSYEGAFKLRIVRYCLGKGLSLTQAASYFKIPNEGVISRWLKVYEKGGAESLLCESRGRKKTVMPKKPRKKAIASEDPATTKLVELQKEVEYLRAENAFLKKLEALAQQEEAVKAQARRRKPSGN